MKRIIVCMLASILALTAFAACGDTTGSKTNNPVKDPESMEKVEDTDYSITFFYGPPYADFTQETVDNMKAAGFDIIPLQRYPGNREAIKSSLQLLKDNGLETAVMDKRLTDLYDMQATPSQERIDKTVQSVVDDYKDYDNIREWILCDEPNSSKFEVLRRIVDAIRRIDPERKAYINLLPNYADTDMLGAASYDEYLQKFCETVKPDYICFDYYDFVGVHYTDSRRGTFLENMESVKAAADKYGVETRVIVLATQHMVYSSVTPAEIAWQANLSLLYGMKSLSYFTYWLPDLDEYYSAMQQLDGEITQHYYDVKNENVKTRVLGNALYNTSCEKVFRVNTELDEVKGPEAYDSYGDLGKVKGSDFLAGFYKNGWFMLMNALANDTDSNKRTLTTESINGTLFWLNPDTCTWESFHSCDNIKLTANGQYEITLRAGDSILLRVKAD